MKKIICSLLAAVSLFYYFWLGIHNSFRMSVLPFWLLLSVFFLLLGYHTSIPVLKNIPCFLRRAFTVCICVVFTFFLLIESCILWGMTGNNPEHLDYIIIPGAGLNGDKPSPVLEMRLSYSCSYLEAHPETIVIVSGGQGPTEPISEAESMKNWLTAKGIDNSRIIMEDISTTTAENMRYSFSCIQNGPDSLAEINVGIVTSNFHVFRSVCIASHAADEFFPPNQICHIYGLSAPFSPRLLPHYMVREFFAICVDALLGNMNLPF
ncbi:MAG TPA: hypothetical protein DCZ40_12465 [Lachnospiraceae bacterium]|nr:hypothetical protein [Lachnospiraceae bacterium]